MPRGRSEASISQSPLWGTRSARTVRTLRSTSRSMEFDLPGVSRLAGQVLGTTNRPAVMAMDAWREGDVFQIDAEVLDLHLCALGGHRDREHPSGVSHAALLG